MAWLTEAALRKRAGAAIFERGRHGVNTVTDLAHEAGAVTATVLSSASSSVTYRVRLQERHGEPAGTCTCPHGLEGNFCKHCVAVGLRQIRGPGEDPAPEMPPEQQQWEAVEAFLAGRTPQELADLLHDVVRDDRALRRRLWRLATASDPARLRKQVERLSKQYGAGEGAAYAEQAHAIVFTLGHQPAPHHTLAQKLLRSVLQKLLTAVDRDLDDYGPGKATIEDDEPVLEVIPVAWRAYLRQYRPAPPTAAQVAQWFVGLRLSHPYSSTGMLASDLAQFDGVLTACLQTLATAKSDDAKRRQALHEELLGAAGDTEGHVALLARDLSSYQAYVRIAEVLVDAGRIDQAVGWLERAREPGAKLSDDPAPVAELLARLYANQGRLADALQVRRRHFASARTERAYRVLRAAADQAGAAWPPVRDEALSLLRQAAGPGLPPGAEKGNSFTIGRWADAAETLARLLIEEGAPDEAWDVVQRHQLRGWILIMAANARAVTHPADGIGVYWSEIERILNVHSRGGNRSHERIADLLLVLKDLITRNGGNFRMELAKFKATHRGKRRLLEELARRGL